jgi:xanthine dehydrogenase accessory factor
MNRQLQIWQLIESSLQQNIPVMLLYVLESNGSSPGRQGFFMAVNASNEMKGSIGGGIMEHKFVEMAKEKLKAEGRRQKAEVRKQVHDKSATKHQSGMICSGEQTILFYPLIKEDAMIVQQVMAVLMANENAALELSPKGISFSSSIPTNDFSFVMQADNDWLYQEKLGYKNHLYIIGAGHCALALCELMNKMDFHIHLYDDRENLNTFLQNSFVQEKLLLNDYNELKCLVPSGNNHYVVIMTFGYRTDTIAIKALLHKQFKYKGVLGSSNKMKKLFADFEAEGIDQSKLDQIHTPIGLQIKSETPEEIAVSIAAEIISIKNQF